MTSLNIKYVNEAKDGKKYGSIKTAEGATYMLPAGMRGVFQPGTTVDVPVKQETWGKDADAKVVHIISGRPGSAGSGAVAQHSPPPYPPTNTSQPAPPPAGSARMSNADGKDVMITTIALMKSFIETGTFGLTDLPALEAACIPAAKRIVGASQ